MPVPTSSPRLAPASASRETKHGSTPSSPRSDRATNTASWPEPKGGFFLWLALPPEIDTEHMLERAVKHGVIYVAGEAFFVNHTGANMARLSFSAPTPERIEEGVGRLAATLRAELEALTAGPPRR